MKIVRRIGRFFLVSIITVLILLLSVAVAIQIPAVQSEIAKFAVEKLNKSLNTKMYVDRVNIDFFGRIYLYEVDIEDDRNLKFIKTDTLETSLSIWSIIFNPDYINLKEVKLLNPEIRVITYKGDKESNFIKFINNFSSDKPKDPDRPFKLDGNLWIENGQVSIVNQNNGQTWLDAKNLQLTVKDFKLDDDDIWATFENFCFSTMRNGEPYTIHNFTGNAHYSPKEIRVDNLFLQTDTSLVKGNLVMAYAKPEDLSDFNNKVFWNANFERGSKINFKEIRYFSELFDKDSGVEIFGKIDGTLNNLVLTDFELKGHNNYVGAARLQLQDMMNGSLKMNTKNLKANTSYGALTNLLPKFAGKNIPDFIQRFGTMDYRGDLSLDPTEIQLKGYALTALGDADIAAKLKHYSNPKTMQYAGTVDAKNLNLRQITEVKELGYVSGKIRFDGVGTDISKMKLDVDGKLNYLDLMDKRYQNITVDGLVKDYQFNGLFDIKDPQLNAQLNGRIQFDGKPYRFDFKSNVRHINLDYLGLTKNMNAIVRADIIGDFSLTNINDFRGDLDIKNLYFRSKRDTIEFDHIELDSRIDGTHKIMTLNVPEYMKATLDGRFNVTEIADVMNNALVDLVPSFKRKKISPHQAFNFDINIEQNLLQYIDPSIQIEPYTTVKGYINSDENKLDVILDTPGLQYAGVQLFKSNLVLNTSLETNNLNAAIDSLVVGGMKIKELMVQSVPKNDTLLVQTDFKIGDKNPVVFDLNLFHSLDEKKNMIFGFTPSTIQIDSTTWDINKDNLANSNRLIFNPAKKSFMVQDLMIESDDQHLSLNGMYNQKEDFNFDAEFDNLSLEKIIPKGVLNGLKLEGIANGKAKVLRSETKLEPTLETVISELTVNDFLLGDLTLNGGYDVKENIFDFGLSLQKGAIESLMATGNFINKKTGPEVDINANFDEFHVDFLEGFLSTVFSNMRGSLSGDVHIDGPVALPNIEGNLVAKDLGLKVNFLGTDYLFEGENPLYVSKQGNGQGIIMMDDIKFKDTAYNSVGYVNGAILFKSLSKWGLNLQFDTENLLVMNTKMSDNELFYGRIYAKGDISMMGAVEELGIFGDATVVGNSELTINTGSTTIESENKLVRFVPDQHLDKKKVDEVRTPKGMNIDVNINAYPNALVNLIFDAKTNDKASARGTAENLRFRMNNTGLNLTGVYNIESGVYNFRQGVVLNKDFDVRKGSVVQFSGNPMDATLNITAIYDKSVSNVGDYLGIGYSQMYDAELAINITQTLAKPVITFDVTMPNASSDINSQLQSKFRSNQEELVSQFVYILLTGKFGDASALTTGVTSTAADIGLSTLAGMLSSMITDVDVELEYVGGSVQSQTNDKVRYSVSYQINNRLRIRGSYGMAVRNQFTENFDGNFDLSYDISKNNNGALMLKAFTKPTTFGIQTEQENSTLNQSYGAGILYNANFNNFSEFLGKESKKAKKEAKAQISTEPMKSEPVDSVKINKAIKEEEKALKDATKNTNDSNQVSFQKEQKQPAQRPKRGLMRIK